MQPFCYPRQIGLHMVTCGPGGGPWPGCEDAKIDPWAAMQRWVVNSLLAPFRVAYSSSIQI